MNCDVEVLLPFPSTSWSTSTRAEEVAKAAGTDTYLRERLPLAYAPKVLDDFGAYAAETVRHYRRSQPQGVTHFQVLNEPVYTDYALPREFGYAVEDYVRLLEVAYRAIKALSTSFLRTRKSICHSRPERCRGSAPILTPIMNSP